jgi:hypothetical protein
VLNESAPGRCNDRGINPFLQRSLVMSIPTPTVPAPQAKSLSAADLLAGATKKGKTSSHLVYPGEAGRQAAVRWLELDAQLAENERELALVRDQILDVVRPWHEETCARRRAHEASDWLKRRFGWD